MKILLLSLLICVSVITSAQTENETKLPTREINGVEYEIHNVDKATFFIREPNDTIYQVVENMPEYPGGQKTMFSYIAGNLKYPPAAKANGISGKVFINFIVDKTGNVTEITVIRKVHPILDEEALRVVKSMPKWTPGTHNGRPVAVSYNLPLNFVLIGNSKQVNENPFTPIIEKDLPAKAESNYKKGMKALKKKNYNKAIEYFSLAINDFPNYRNALFNRAFAYQKTNNLDNACKDWKKCNELGVMEAPDKVAKNCK